MSNANRNPMRFKFSISFVFFIAALLCCNYSVYGQRKRNKTDTACIALYNRILIEHDAGHFSMVDTLFSGYRSSPCFAFTAANQLTIKKVLKIVIAQKRLDNYRFHEAESLQKELDAINTQFPEPSDTSFYQFRFGPSSSFNLAKTGPPGWSAGFTLGINVGNLADSVWSADIGALYQRMPFSININNAKFISKGSHPAAYLLVTSGHNSLYQFPVRLSYNIWQSREQRFGDGIVGGAELLDMQSTYLGFYHYEYNFSVDRIDSINMQQVNYDNRVKPLLHGKPFFTNTVYVNLIIGDNFYWRISDRFLAIFSPEYHQNVVNRMIIQNIFSPPPYHPYQLRPNSFQFRFTLSYLFKKTIIH